MQVRSIRADITIQVSFERPLFGWQRVAERFFSALYERIEPHFNISMRDFSVANTTNLGEAWVKFSLFGNSNNSVSLFADRLEIRFASLVPSDYPIANQIARLSHDAILEEFREIVFETLSYQDLEHFELIGQSSSSDFLDQFAPSKLIELSSNWRGVLEPGIKFRHISEDQNSTVTLLGERSVLSASAIFLVATVLIKDVKSMSGFEKKYAYLSENLRKCTEAIGLEIVSE